MNTLITPVCGKSTRFPNLRPKWMLTHPNGNFMVVQSILGLNLSEFSKIVITALEEHETQFKFLKGLTENLESEGLGKKVSVNFLKKLTDSQPETIYEIIKQEKIKGSIFIKDCDNFFHVKNTKPQNCIIYSCLADSEEINPNNKSYIKLNQQGIVENIIEKQIISTTFSCGGYGFENANDFCKTFKKLQMLKKDLYISDVVFDMMLEGKVFYGVQSSNYSDWGTVEAWNKYKENFKTLFIDMDGTLVQHSSSHFPPYIGETSPLQKNITHLLELHTRQNLTIIITTSRKEKYRKDTEKQLKTCGLPYNKLIMGLPHGKRYIINDFSNSNPYPAAVAINLKRDGDDLKNYL